MSERSRSSTGDIELADFLEQYIGKYIALADTKAAATFTVAAGVIAYLFSKDTIVAALKAGNPLALIAIAALGLSAFLSFLVIWPRRSTSAEGIIFWRSIAKFARSDQFIDRVRGSSPQKIAEDRLTHCYDIACVCTRKYDVLAWSMPIGLIGVLVAFAVLLVL